MTHPHDLIAMLENMGCEFGSGNQALREPPRASHDEHPLTIWGKE